MDNKEAIIQATIKLIEEKGEHLEEVTVREICKRAGVGLGLVNYHFGNKWRYNDFRCQNALFKQIRE